MAADKEEIIKQLTEIDDEFDEDNIVHLDRLPGKSVEGKVRAKVLFDDPAIPKELLVKARKAKIKSIQRSLPKPLRRRNKEIIAEVKVKNSRLPQNNPFLWEVLTLSNGVGCTR